MISQAPEGVGTVTVPCLSPVGPEELLRARARRDVPVRDRHASKEIAHAAADEVGAVAPFAKGAGAVEERRRYLFGIERA